MRTKTLDTVLTIGAFIISIAGLAIGIAIMLGYESLIDLGLSLTYGCLIVAAGVAVIFGVYQIITNLKRNLPMLGGLIVFIVLGFICYSIADDTVLRGYVDITPQISKISGAALFLMYILTIAALLSAIIGEATRLFK